MYIQSYQNCKKQGAALTANDSVERLQSWPMKLKAVTCTNVVSIKSELHVSLRTYAQSILWLNRQVSKELEKAMVHPEAEWLPVLLRRLQR